MKSNICCNSSSVKLSVAVSVDALSSSSLSIFLPSQRFINASQARRRRRYTHEHLFCSSCFNSRRRRIPSLCSLFNTGCSSLSFFFFFFLPVVVYVIGFFALFLTRFLRLGKRRDQVDDLLLVVITDDDDFGVDNGDVVFLFALLRHGRK